MKTRTKTRTRTRTRTRTHRMPDGRIMPGATHPRPSTRKRKSY